MSSYGNHVWTQEREDAARKLVDAAMDCDDDGFAEILHGMAGINIGWPFGPEAPRMYQPGPEGFRELLAVTVADRMVGRGESASRMVRGRRTGRAFLLVTAAGFVGESVCAWRLITLKM
jgi:hypothetical protein